MDQEIIAFFRSKGEAAKVSKAVKVLDLDTGEVELTAEGETRKFTLKSLQELFGAGMAAAAKEFGVQPTDPAYMPLYQGIEAAISMVYEDDRMLTDADALWALEHLGQRPEAPITGAGPGVAVARSIVFGLRLQLTLGDYSRQEVRTALRTVARSVKRHTATGGIQGYLRFIEKYT